jgi:uncharacterized protein YfkK (UPF0435 family)
MIADIRKKLNIVNQGLLNPDKFKNANQQDIEEIHNFVPQLISNCCNFAW